MLNIFIAHAILLQMYRGIAHAIKEMYKENGIRTFYKGEMYSNS